MRGRREQEMTAAVPPRYVAVVDGNAAGRTGISALLQLQPGCRVLAEVGSAEAFWQVPGRQLWQLDEVLVHAGSLAGAPQSGQIFIRQVRLLLPGVRVRVLGSEGAGGDGEVVYGAPLDTLREVLGQGGWRKGGAVTPLTAGEWRVLAGAMSGVAVQTLARETGRSVKTLYGQRYSGLRRLGVSRLPVLLTAVPARDE